MRRGTPRPHGGSERRRKPQIRIPPDRESRAALDAFEVARREAVAPAAASLPHKKSPVPFIAAGAVVVAGAGVALAAGGGSTNAERNPIPPAFTATSATGTPQLLLLSAVPPSIERPPPWPST